ncbi:MAG: hypothetical protein M1134_03235 [Actinobacteria bacterium]|nr:hypothetical protein [Actinomycetota bacterium]
MHRSSRTVRLKASISAKVALVALMCLGLGGTAALAGSLTPAAAASGFAVANGFASYAPSTNGSAPAVVQFSTTTLASGGTADPATLSVVSQPASGTASADTSNGILTYAPTASTTGTQVVSFQLCESGPSNCKTATLTYGPGIDTYQAAYANLSSSLGVIAYAPYRLSFAANGPSHAVPGQTFTESMTASSIKVPSNFCLGATCLMVNYITGLAVDIPLPANAKYISSQLVGGDAVTAGNFTLTYCTTFAGGANPACTALKPNSSFPTVTTTPYLEMALKSGIDLMANQNVSFPTVNIDLTATGGTITFVETEFDMQANVTMSGKTGTVPTQMYPTTPSFNKVVYGSPSSPPPAPPYFAQPLAVIANGGYWEVASDGGIFALGDAPFFGSMGGKPLNKPVVGMAATPNYKGYWEVASDGGIFAFGNAGFYGSMGGKPLNKPIVGIASTPDGKGYWEVASDGGIFAFGDAQFYGSMGGKPLNLPIVGIASTPNGGGYWEVASDGGIFAFGNAGFYGSTGGVPLLKPIVGIAADPNGGGYWEVSSNGVIFPFGSAPYVGSMANRPLNNRVVTMAATATGNGYWMAATDGGIFNFGDASYYGSMGGQSLNKPIVGMAFAGGIP